MTEGTTMPAEREAISTEGPQCPYCGCQYTADDSVYFDEMNYTSEDCQDCGETFSVEVYTETTWTTKTRESTHE